MTFVEFHRSEKINVAVVYPDVFGISSSLSPEARLEEACGLALAIRLEVVFSKIVKVRNVKPSTLVGQGIIDELEEVVSSQGVELIIFDTSLTPIQQRNLEKKLNVKVIDRTALILEIFGERAQTKEGKLQVELAHLTYQRSRLVRSWTHLERQRGGGGFLGGPGETQIELDRRLIDDKILRIKQELEKVKKTRAIQRSARQRVPYPVVAFVGYTNAGKSTLFNKLSGSHVFAKDLLFATLDPSMCKIKLPSGREIILSDTVGFISDLPHELVMAFRATLEEVLSADLIVHVRDAAISTSSAQRKDVLDVLQNLGVNDFSATAPYLEVLNKVDLLSADQKKKLSEKSKAFNVLVSALTGEGCQTLLQCIDDKLSVGYEELRVVLGVSEGKKIAWLHQHAQIISSRQIGESLHFVVRLGKADLAKFTAMR